MFALAIKGYNNATINLDKVDIYEGVVIDRGITMKRSKKMSLKVFYFKMEGLDDLLASYNMSQDYSKLMSSVKNGDYLTVYFKESKSQDLNLNVIQIEKDSIIILDKNEFETKERGLIYIGSIGGVLMLAGFVWLIVKTRTVFSTQ